MPIQELITKLAGNELVIGIACYGSAATHGTGADYDLFVFSEADIDDLESIHFHFQGTPVDMSLRSLSDLDSENPVDQIDFVLSDAEIHLDRTGTLGSKIDDAIKRWRKADSFGLSEHERNYNRFCQRHVLDKVGARISSDPLYCHFLLATNVYWLVETYFRVRELSYPGERKAIKHLGKFEPNIYMLIQRFYGAGSLDEKLKISESLTDLVMEPIGGAWRTDEILSFGRTAESEDLITKGQRVYNALMC